MARRLFTIAATVSLVTCIAACTLWAVSYFASVGFAYAVERRDSSEAAYGHAATGVIIRSGTLYVFGASAWMIVPLDDVPVYSDHYQWTFDDVAGRQRWLQSTTLGFSWHTEATVITRPVFGWQISAPICFVALLTVILPYLRWRRHGAAWRAAAGLCRRCGYDLRATPGRCPERGSGR
jgi:hypothetical protein